MAIKTQPTNDSVMEFLDNYPNQEILEDCKKMIQICENITNSKAVMWGKMIGFDTYKYKYQSGHQGEFFVLGFAPSKVGITIYTNCDLIESDLVSKLGKYKISKACLYIKKLEDIDLEVLKIVLENSYKDTKLRYGK